MDGKEKKDDPQFQLVILRPLPLLQLGSSNAGEF